MSAAAPTPPAPPIPDEVTELVRTLEAAGHEAWCVGGALRDALLGAPGADVDIATSATPEQVMALFRRTVPVGLRFGTVGVLDRQRRLHEVTTFRHDVETDGRHAVVRYGASLEEDLARRDFTINALAYHPLRREWRDPFGGAADLRAGVVRAVGEPAQRFREDWLRILRALRFAARLDFAIEPATWAAVVAGAAGLHGLSAERVRDEWFKSLRTARRLAHLVRLWHDAGAARVWLPELAAEAPAEVPLAERDPVLLTVLLTRDAPAVLRRLKASNAELARAQGCAAGPAEPAGDDERAVRHWLAAVGERWEDLGTLATWRAGGRAAGGQGSDGGAATAPGTAAPWSPGTVRWLETAQRVIARGDATSVRQLAVSGADLLTAGVPAGPAVGATLQRLLARVLDEPALNTRESLLALAREPA